jgi:hypothetical protein
LKPVDDDLASQMVRGLIGAQVEQRKPTEQGTTTSVRSPGAETQGEQRAGREVEQTKPVETEARSTDKAEAQPSAKESKVSTEEAGAQQAGTPQERVDLNPQSLNISSEELIAMENLAPVIGRSPRAIKRFVNLYRLFKTMLPDEAFEEFLDESVAVAPYRVVMLFLAIITGTPQVSRDFFRLLNNSQLLPPAPNRKDIVERILKHLSRPQDQTPTQQMELARLESWNEKNRPKLQPVEWTQEDLGVLTKWAARVARYSFRIDLAQHGRMSDSVYLESVAEPEGKPVRR